MKVLITLLLTCLIFNIQAQSSLKGRLEDSNNASVPFANIILFNSSDSNMIKVETTNESGEFNIMDITAGNYFLKATFVGFPDLIKNDIQLLEGETKDLKVLTFEVQSDLEEVVVTIERDIVEVKPDRTIFNVEGTINAVGLDAISLLRKAPAVSVDNNDNINVLGRSGVMVYIDGKQLPLTGSDLSNYLKNLSADQIDRIEIISSPGAKYEAEGNAGIIDIKLKKDDSIGAYGSISSTFTKGILTRYNTNLSGNYRTKTMNVFGTIGYNKNDNFHNINFISYQNGIYMDEINNSENRRNINNYRIGTDFFLHKNHTLGFLVGARIVDGEEISYNKIEISDQQNISIVDSVLIAENSGINDRIQNTYNLNYRFFEKKRGSLNIDFDYGSYQNKNTRYQPNLYYNATVDKVLTKAVNSFDTPNDINIYTAKLDYEKTIGKGKLGVGSKYSKVVTNNTFKVFNEADLTPILNNTLSNLFDYDENVYAGYVSYSSPISKKIKAQGGLRIEKTLATGDLTPFLTTLKEDPVELNYLNLFPSAGITWDIKEKQSLALNYGRRINRPDYNVLNPFRKQLSQLSFEKGNPNLSPEIVNNVELGYTLNYKYNFKVAYGLTTDKITRLIGPDDIDPRAGFISWDNLATQEVISINASLPITIFEWWSSFNNLSASHTNNQADYGNGAIVDVQNFGYMIYQQNTFNLLKGFKGEVSGYYSGPGVWGGVFVYESNWSLDVGLQKLFFNNKLKARLSANNIFNRFGWRGKSEFNGLISAGDGMWDSRFVSLSLSYSFGNKKIKSNNRNTGIESESKRVGG